MHFCNFLLRKSVRLKNLRPQILLVLMIGLVSCGLSLINTQQTSSLLDEFSVSTQEEDHHEWAAKVTEWRDDSEVRAWLRVEQLKGQYLDTGTFYRKTSCNSLVQNPHCVISDSNLPDGHDAYAVVLRGTRRNDLGQLEFVRLDKFDRSCVYTLQF